jgi:hypothetical protein
MFLENVLISMYTHLAPFLIKYFFKCKLCVWPGTQCLVEAPIVLKLIGVVQRQIVR